LKVVIDTFFNALNVNIGKLLANNLVTVEFRGVAFFTDHDVMAPVRGVVRSLCAVNAAY
jgi:hypothetical protein